MFETEKARATVKVVNVVASATLGQRVNLEAVVRSFPNAKFPSERFPGLVFRLKKPKTATLIFGSGNLVCTGARSENEAINAVENLVRELSGKGLITPQKPEIKIDNIVASANLMQNVDLYSASRFQGTMYEPDQFPALIYRMDEPKVVFLIFSSGRLICVGAKSEKEAHRAVRRLIQKLEAVERSESASFNRAYIESETGFVEGVPVSRFKLKDFTFSDSHGKGCIYASGLWCSNKSCTGPSCKFANLILGRLIDGFYGCWGFDWLEEWYRIETKKSQRKFNN